MNELKDSQAGRPHRTPVTRDIGIYYTWNGRSDAAAREGFRGFLYKGQLYKVYTTPFDTPYDVLLKIGADILDNKQYRFKFLLGHRSLSLVPVLPKDLITKPQVEIVEE